MPRPKGSKNKKSIIPETVAIENIDEMVSAAQAEIEKLAAELKSKKAELKKLLKMQEAQIKAAAAKKAEEDKAAILAAVEASGKSVEEILDLLKTK